MKKNKTKTKTHREKFRTKEKITEIRKKKHLDYRKLIEENEGGGET